MEKNKGLFSFRKHPVGDFPDGEKGRKRKGGRLRQSMGFLMVAALIFNTLPASGLAVSASEQEKGLCEHHTEHTAECGYAEAQPCTHEHTEEKHSTEEEHSGEECYKTVTECVHEHTDECYPETEETEESTGKGNATPSDAGNREPSLCTHVCSEESGCITKILDCHHEHDESCGYKEAQDCGYVCEICNGTKPEDTKENTENTEASDTDTAECICETLCTEDSINEDCSVCGAEGADLSSCKGEKTEVQEVTGEKVITAWEWIDPEEYLTDGILALPGAGRENPAFVEDVTALLPEKIQAKVAAVNAAEDGEETEEDAEAAPETEDAEITLTGWKCASYPEDGAYEGTYTFTAFLPEGFVLAEDAAALEVEVELGGGEMLEGEVSVTYQEASWNGGVTYTTKTADSCTPVADSTTAVTWNAGWYVVNSTVTIDQPITVNGEVNLILADGCTLTAGKGIVVETGNSLTIYAQSGGTGTLNATGTTDSSNNASAGIGSSTSSDSGAITIHGGVINATGGSTGSNGYGGAGIGGGTSKSANGGNSGTIIIYGGTVTANSGAGRIIGAGIGGGGGGGDAGGAGSNITIYGGSVTAASTGTQFGGAGIGGGFGLRSGGAGNNIQIYGGTINATGGDRGVGIGGGGSSAIDDSSYKSGDGAVTISGGNVTAVGGNYAAGIGGGGGYYYSTQYTSGGCTGGTGSVTISGGIVDASSPTDVYWTGYEGAPIGNGGNATATATVNKTTGIVFENGAGTVCGAVTFDGSYTVPAGYTLNIPAGASLSGSGTLSGGGTFTTENLTEDMISVPEGWHYTGEDLTEKIKSAVSLNGEITICGQTFTASTDGWELSVEKVSELEYTVKYTHTDKGTLSKTVTIARGQTALSDVVTYKEDGTTPANTFSVGETIIVKATATFPANNAIMAAAEFDTPTGEQMAVYYNDTQISAPSTVENGVHTMTVDTSNLPESALNEEIALTVKYIESGNASGATATTNVTVTAVARVKKDSTTTYVGALADAFTEGNSGATVTLLSEVDLGSNYIGIRGSSTFTLDLNGQTIKASYYGAFDISGGSLTIQDSGTGGKIESSNITIEVTGGTLSIQSGTVSGYIGVKISSGAVNISGGTISGSDTGLKVTGGGNIAISGGTFSGVIAVEIHSNASVTLKDLLAAGYAYHQNDIPVANAEGPGGEVPLDAKPAWLPGTVTVKECNHTGGLVPNENGYQHGGPCKCCGAELTAENHTLGADNHCSGCGAELVAKVNDTCYTDFQSAWSAAQSTGTATVTLLADVNLGDQCITLSAGNITLTGSGRTLTGSGSQTIEVTGGELIVENVTVKNTNSGIHVPSGKIAKVTVGENATVTGSTGIYQQSGSLTVFGTVEGTNSSGFGVMAQGVALTVEEGSKISGGNEGIRHTVGGSLTINGGTINGRIAGVQITEDVTAKLNGGTFTGVYNAVAINGSTTTTMGNLLNTGYAIFKDDGTAVERTLTSTGPGTFTVQECQHDGVAATSNNNGTHSINCPYCGHTGTATNCAYVFSGTTGTCAECGDSVTVSVTDNLIYDGTEKKPEVTVTRGETALTAGTDYTVVYADNIDAGTAAKVTVTIGNNQGTYNGSFTIGKATPTIAWSSTSQELTYTDQQAVITAPTVTLENNENFGGTISYSYKKQGETDYKDGLPTDAGTYTVKAHVDAEGNYNAADSTNELTLTIKKADTEITVGTAAYDVNYGDPAFTISGVTDTNPETAVQYAVTEGTDVISVSNGTVTIKNAGTATITVSLPETANYNAAANKTITVTVAKKGGYTVSEINKKYYYDRENTAEINLASLLPRDCGTVTYGEPVITSGNMIFTAKAVENGVLSYTLAKGNVNDAGTITVTITTRNYEDITVTVKAVLTDQIPVELKEGTEVTLANTILTYGESLSGLGFNNAVFVDGDGKTVEGILAWKDAAAKPSAGTTSAVWVFIPTDNAYAPVEGTAAITVNKAVPTVSAVPIVADRIYNPSVTLKGDDLTGATVTGVDGNTLKGGWNWQSADIVPTVNNNGYAAIFTPEDTTNYETVTRTITVNVAKATPYIAKSPAAAGITYGDTLNASALSGGTVQYGNGAGQAGDGAGSTAAVAGTFTWKEPSAKPVVADSNVTEYTVVLTPSDTANYNPVEAKVTLTVNKAQNAPNMPGSTMDVSNSLEKVGDVSLPQGWEWQASDQDTALEVGKTVSAVAVYAGADKGNYENETVTVAITRSACDHVAGEILYTGAGEKAPACTEDGLGHRECTKCGSVVESGIVVKAPGHTGGTATCSKRAVCTRCGQPYGDTDGSVHGDTEVRGFVAATCTAGGYTGDTYCKDCGAKTKTGNATPALGHNYTSTVTKEPTTGSEGTRTYTCTRCGHSYTESIPKLPEETHHHSYSGSVTKQPTCTDTGIRTYTCSCGDSYTETIAALGHHYQSSVTKQPTATAEGVMTYTCIRCGHSYTRPIAKLPGDDTAKPGDDTTKPGDDTTKPGDDTTKPGDDTAKPGDTKPDGGIAETRPDTGIPFIKDEDGKIGWDVIRAEEEQAQEGSTINVDMNGSVVVPGDIFDSIKGKDITITFDMGDGIIWSVNGKSITIDKAGDIDFSVQTGVNTVPVDIVNNVTGERYSIQISLAHEGEFGFTAVLSIGLGRENAGYTASLYYYNKSTGELEFICSDEVAEDGTVSLAFTHASDYVIAIDGDEEEESSSVTELAQPEDEAGDSAGKEEELPQTGQAWRPWWFIVVGALVIIMGIGLFFVVKKKKESERG